MKKINDRSNTIENLDEFLEACDNGLINDGSYLCNKKTVKGSSYRLNRHEPDFIAFVVSEAKKLCYVVELKDGDNFDTKKSAADSLTSSISLRLPLKYSARYSSICSPNLPCRKT